MGALLNQLYNRDVCQTLFIMVIKYEGSSFQSFQDTHYQRQPTSENNQSKEVLCPSNCPNMGVVLPKSTCDIIVTMQAQKEAPADMQCKDKFLLQRVKVNDGVAEKRSGSGSAVDGLYHMLLSHAIGI